MTSKPSRPILLATALVLASSRSAFLRPSRRAVLHSEPSLRSDPSLPANSIATPPRAAERLSNALRRRAAKSARGHRRDRATRGGRPFGRGAGGRRRSRSLRRAVLPRLALSLWSARAELPPPPRSATRRCRRPGRAISPPSRHDSAAADRRDRRRRSPRAMPTLALAAAPPANERRPSPAATTGIFEWALRSMSAFSRRKASSSSGRSRADITRSTDLSDLPMVRPSRAEAAIGGLSITRGFLQRLGAPAQSELGLSPRLQHRLSQRL